VILGLVPLVDALVGDDASNPPRESLAGLEEDRYYRLLIWLFVPLQYAAFGLGLARIAAGDLAVLEAVGLAITMGYVGGHGINAAHELGHKSDSLERRLSKIALAQSFYGHFYVEHNRGHHVKVATPEDPSSARLGESFYRFLPRTVCGSLVDAWRLEARRLARRGLHPFRLGNDVVDAFLLSSVLWGTVVLWLGPAVIPYLLLQAAVGIGLLEAVNYIQHYGLLRCRVDGGRDGWEPVAPQHSWNSNSVVSNVLLYHLQRHSDHHLHPTRRYQALCDDGEALRLPAGYVAMLLLALLPPLFSRVMDPLVARHYGGDLRLANVSPHARGRLLRRYPAPSPVAVGDGRPA
jgi:alkane 1-monooxygenase